jgi:hypothetical protein
MPGVLETAGVDTQVRQLLFWGVCIWVRLGVAVLTLLALLTWPVPALIGTATVTGVVVITNISRTNSVWWHRSDHIIAGSVVVVTAIAAIAVGDTTISPWIILGVFIADVFLGMGRGWHNRTRNVINRP